MNNPIVKGLHLILITTSSLASSNISKADDAQDYGVTPNLCEQCHGPDGNSTDPLSPSLAGQNAQYTSMQLKAFRDGVRRHPYINSKEVELSDSQIGQLASFFASKSPQITQGVKLDSDLPDFAPCSGCHGVKGEGVGPYPRLAGQQPGYLKKQLINFQTGKRKNKVMKTMVFNLGEDKIEAIANYLGTMR